MRLKLMVVKTTTKQINRAKVTGKISLVAAAKLDMLRYYMEFAKAEIALGNKEYEEKHRQLIDKINKLTNSCPDIICNIREESCSSGQYEISTGVIINPYNPTPPSTTPVEPEPEPEVHNADMQDITIYPEYNVTTVLTVDLFDNKYIDDQGHTYDAIKIEDINTTNLGTFNVNNIAITVDQIILKSQIANGEFTHVGSDTQAIISDSFVFSARDAVTGEWIQ